jgi:hypothetical protein
VDEVQSEESQMFSRHMLSMSAAAALLVVAAVHAAPVVVVDDQFNDGDRIGGSDPLDSPWYTTTNGPATFVGVDTDGRFRIETTATSPTGFNPVPSTTFSPQTLSTGDKLRVSFESVLTTPLTPGTTNVFRFGLYNSGGTTLNNDLIGAANTLPNTGGIFNNDLGYTVYAPTNQAGTVNLYPRISANASFAISGAAHGPVLPGSAAVGLIPSGTATNHVLELTRTATGYDYYVEHAGVSFSGSTTTVTTSTFDQIQLIAQISAPSAANNPLGLAQSLALDNISVIYTPLVPEPTTLAAVALAGGTLLRRRRNGV